MSLSNLKTVTGKQILPAQLADRMRRDVNALAQRRKRCAGIHTRLKDEPRRPASVGGVGVAYKATDV